MLNLTYLGDSQTQVYLYNGSLEDILGIDYEQLFFVLSGFIR